MWRVLNVCILFWECLLFGESVYHLLGVLSGKVNQVEALNERKFICLLWLSSFLVHHLLKISSLTVTHLKWAGPIFSSKSEPHWKSISLRFNVSPLCSIFHTCRSHLWSSGSHVGSNAPSTGSHSGSGNLRWEPSGPGYSRLCLPLLC